MPDFNTRNKTMARPRILIILAITAVAGMPLRADALSGKNGKANRLYNEGKYEEALKTYRDAQLESPEDARLHYNIGNALYRKKKFDDAAAAFEKALATDDAGLQQQAYYNMGNSLYRAGDDLIATGQQEGVEKMKQAIEAYKKALDINPEDTDAKFNIEFVQNKLKELAQNNQNQQQNKQQQQQQHGKQDKKDQQQKQQEQQQQTGQDKKEEPQPQPGEEKKKGEMSEEDAKRILDALKDEEKDLQKKLRRMPGKSRGVVKDW